jgi:hypothetical protein
MTPEVPISLASSDWVQVIGPGVGSTYLDTGTYSYDGLGNIIGIGSDSYSYL